MKKFHPENVMKILRGKLMPLPPPSPHSPGLLMKAFCVTDEIIPSWLWGNLCPHSAPPPFPPSLPPPSLIPPVMGHYGSFISHGYGVNLYPLPPPSFPRAIKEALIAILSSVVLTSESELLKHSQTFSFC